MEAREILRRKFMLSDYAHRFGTDKEGHEYLPAYAAYLPEKCRSLLEIGCLHGASLYLWNAFYGVDCDIHTIDLFLDPNNMSVRACRTAGFVPHQGDQADIAFLAQIPTQFEVIIDDGSHNAHHQLISWKHLFVNNLRPGGLYVVEDLACCKEPFYWGGLVTELWQTMLIMLQDFQLTGELRNPYLEGGEIEVFKNIIDRVYIENEKIAFIWKK